MSVFAVNSAMGLLFEIAIKLGWRYFTRRLTPEEYLNWTWRKAFPYRCWMRMMATLSVVPIGIIAANAVVACSQNDWEEVAYIAEVGLKVVAWIWVLGTFAFYPWYVNGVYLLDRQTKESDGVSNDRLDSEASGTGDSQE